MATTTTRAARLPIHRIDGELRFLVGDHDGYAVAAATGDDVIDARRVLWQSADQKVDFAEVSVPLNEQVKDHFVFWSEGQSTEIDLDDVTAGWDGYLSDPGYLEGE